MLNGLGKDQTLLADRAYDSDALREHLAVVKLAAIGIWMRCMSR